MCPSITLCVSLSFGGIRVVLKDGTAVEGEKKSENMNFLVLDAGGSPVSILKTIIDTMYTLPPAADTARVPASAFLPPPREESSELKKTAGGAETAATMKIQDIRPTFEQLLRYADTLTVLDLSYSGLEKLPALVGSFKRLRHLDLKGNLLTSLPEEIGDLTTLISLDLRMNRLPALPPQISNLTGLRLLLLTGNKISDNELFHLRRALPSTRIIVSPSYPIRSRQCRPSPFSAKDYARIDSLFTSCGSGNFTACYQLGLLYKNHKDYECALSAFESACRLSDNDTSSIVAGNCEEAALICERFLNDRAKADAFRRHICKIAPHRSQMKCTQFE